MLERINKIKEIAIESRRNVFEGVFSNKVNFEDYNTMEDIIKNGAKNFKEDGEICIYDTNSPLILFGYYDSDEPEEIDDFTLFYDYNYDYEKILSEFDLDDIEIFIDDCTDEMMVTNSDGDKMFSQYYSEGRPTFLDDSKKVFTIHGEGIQYIDDLKNNKDEIFESLSPKLKEIFDF